MDPSSLAADLRQKIEAGLLKPGVPLRQEEIAQQFGVSRQPVRQAFDRLLAEGLLTRRSDRTLVVIGLNEQEVLEVSSIRVLLEREALRLSFEGLDERALRVARRIAEDLADEDDPVRLEELDVAFHAALYQRCENKRLLRLIESLRRESRRAYKVQPKHSVNRRRFVAEHKALLTACEHRDLPRALTALATHLLPDPHA
jgi:DNA-binding GntR family transcriptional regulator